MLTKVAHCLQEHGPQRLADVARRVDADPEAVRGMLDLLTRRGRVERVMAACGGCTACGADELVYFRLTSG